MPIDDERGGGCRELPWDGQPGPARPISAARSADMVRAAMAAAETRAAAPPRWRYAVAAAIVLGLLGTAAAAVIQLGRRPPEAPTAAPPATPSPAAPRSPATGPATGPVPAPGAPASDPRAPSPAPSMPSQTASAAAPPRVAAASTPRDLLRRANELRAAHRWRAAERTYRRVIEEHASSNEAYAARVAAAALRHEHLRDPRGALRLYGAAEATRPAGALHEEAIYGIAECHRALRQSALEAEALRRFLREYPRSPLAPTARDRLQQLTSATAGEE